jgi:hypothetical protein
MLRPPHDPADAIGPGSGSMAARRTWRRSLDGLVLGVGGLLLVIAGMPGVTGSALPERVVEPDARAGGSSAEPAGIAAPLRLAWTPTRPEERGHAAPTRRNARVRSREERPRSEQDRSWDLCLLLVKIERNQQAPWTQQCPGPLASIEQESR